MKKIIIIVVFLLFSGNNIQAQRLYLRTGLGVSISTSSISFLNKTSDSQGNLATAEVTTKGYGTGMPFDLSLGYRFRNYIGIDLAISYFYGFQIEYRASLPEILVYEKASAHMLSLVPALTFNLSMQKFDPYARIGLKIGLDNRIKYKIHGESTSGSSQLEARFEDYGSVPVGVQFAFGTDFEINENISLFVEAQMNGITFSPAHGKYTQFEVNGVSRLGDLTTKEKSVDYVSYIDYNAQIPDYSPDKSLKFSNPLNNVGFLVGIKVYYSK